MGSGYQDPLGPVSSDYDTGSSSKKETPSVYTPTTSDYDTNRQQAHGVRAREEYQSSRAGREVVNQSITEGMKQNRVGLDPPGSSGKGNEGYDAKDAGLGENKDTTADSITFEKTYRDKTELEQKKAQLKQGVLGGGAGGSISKKGGKSSENSSESTIKPS